MFNDRINDMGLLTPKPRDNILKEFPLDVVKSVVNKVANFLNSCTDINKVLPTDTHVEWVIDTLGYGFTLPIEDEKDGQICLSLYIKWLASGSRPASMNERLPYFLNVNK